MHGAGLSECSISTDRWTPSGSSPSSGARIAGAVGRVFLPFAALALGVAANALALVPAPDRLFDSLYDMCPAGSPMWHLALGDVNEDGRPDLAVANREGDAVTVIFGTSSGLFDGGVTLDTGTETRGLVLADMNRDGHEDVLVATPFQNAVVLFLGDGTGAFGPGQKIVAGSQPIVVAVGDLNGDEWPDFVTATYGSGGVTVVLGGNEAGTFWSSFHLGMGLGTSWVDIADIDDDGYDDLVCGSAGTQSVSVRLGFGNGGFGDRIGMAAGVAPAWGEVADLNGDGHLDIVVAGGGETSLVSVFLGHGDGKFEPYELFPTGRRPYSLQVGDLNGDDIPDVVTADHDTPNLSILRGRGDGTFLAPVNQPGVHATTAVLLHDLGGDGLLDLIVSHRLGYGVAVYRGNWNGTFGVSPRSAEVVPPYKYSLAHMNEDEHLDMISVDLPSAEVRLGAGEGSFGPAVRVVLMSHRPSMATPTLASGDFNGDGWGDLFVVVDDRSGANDDVYVVPSDGTGGYRAPIHFGTAGFYATCFTLGDVNGDGDLDAVVGSWNHEPTRVLLGNGDGTLNDWRDYPWSASGLSLGDLDGDGDLDLVVTEVDGTGVAWGEGDGSFGDIEYLDRRWTRSAIGDVTGDGFPDIVGSYLDTLALVRGSEGGGLAPVECYALGYQTYFVSLRDMNGDGRNEVVMADDRSGLLTVLSIGDDRAVARREDYGVAGANLRLGDLNLDGLTDLIGQAKNGEGIFVPNRFGRGEVRPLVFQAHREEAGVRVAWSLEAHGTSVAALRLLRGEGATPSPSPITDLGGPAGRAVDRDPPDDVLWYWLEADLAEGRTERFGPVRVPASDVVITTPAFSAVRNVGTVRVSWYVAITGDALTELVLRRGEAPEPDSSAAVAFLAPDVTEYLDASPPAGRTFYWLEARSSRGEVRLLGPVFAPRIDSSTFAVSALYPNPARGGVAFGVNLPGATPARMEVFDVAGRRVAIVFQGLLTGGGHVLEWDRRSATGVRAASGTYFLRVATDFGVQVKRLVLQ